MRHFPLIDNLECPSSSSSPLSTTSSMHTDHHLRFRTSRVLSSGHVSHVASLARLPLRRAPRPPTILRRVPRLATPRRAPCPPTVHTAATAPIIAATARTITVTAPTIAATAPTSARAISAGLVDTRRHFASEYYSRIFPSSLRVRERQTRAFRIYTVRHFAFEYYSSIFASSLRVRGQHSRTQFASPQPGTTTLPVSSSPSARASTRRRSRARTPSQLTTPTLTTAATATTIAVTAPLTAATATTSARATSDDLFDTRRLVAFEYFSRIFPSSLRVRVLLAHFLHTYPRLRRHRAFASRSLSTSRHFPRSSS